MICLTALRKALNNKKARRLWTRRLRAKKNIMHKEYNAK